MERRLLVVDVVGLVPSLLGPRLAAVADAGWRAVLRPPLPAVTTTSQVTMLTGRSPADHGIVGNGWYFHDLSEVLFWRQSHRLIGSEVVWDTARRARPDLKVAQMFWWYNMYSSADLSVTPRPEYPADGRKIPGVYTQPAELRAELEAALGPFPLFRFWGPGADLRSTRWIADSCLHVLERHRPDLMLAYLPHLDYVLQQQGPDGPDVASRAAEVDEQAGRLVEAARADGMEVLVVSEYGIGAVSRPVFPNRVLREEGWLTALWQASVGETLDAGASRAFCVCDHQVAHVYVARPEDVPAVAALLEGLDGVGRCLVGSSRVEVGLDHPRAGQIVLEAARDAWFAYPYWLDDDRAPDFARTVDIHRKPGYDPAELFLDPGLVAPRLKVAAHILRKTLGLRSLLEVIPLDPSLVSGSHGRVPAPDEGLWPFVAGTPGLSPLEDGASLAGVADLVLGALVGEEARARLRGDRS